MYTHIHILRSSFSILIWCDAFHLKMLINNWFIWSLFLNFICLWAIHASSTLSKLMRFMAVFFLLWRNCKAMFEGRKQQIEREQKCYSEKSINFIYPLKICAEIPFNCFSMKLTIHLKLKFKAKAFVQIIGSQQHTCSL